MLYLSTSKSVIFVLDIYTKFQFKNKHSIQTADVCGLKFSESGTVNNNKNNMKSKSL